MSDPVAGNAAPPPDAAAASTPPPDPATTPEANLIDTKLLANELVKNLDAPAAENQITPAADPGPEVKFKLVYNKTNYEIVMGENRTVRELKDHIETLTKLPRAMQKLMFKGLVKDDTKTLKELKVVKNSKMMCVGTTMSDLVAVTTKPSSSEIVANTSSVTKKEPLSKQKIHQKVLDKGKPEDAMPGIIGVKQPLPSHPLNGMVNKTGGKVRLTFKLEEDSLWIGTKARTEKISMSSIRNVVSEKIEANPEYYILGIQLGPTELSIYWIYWIPAQYVDAVKDTILGKWQTFF
ncbi:ubiquitin domain-containing protein UBFD1-like [Bolinopsis microptera]|uniref:ubiquitin domain-containing protein UBFD1-like n=1 Tax=Bolinopsis microptera TaxID=2820187 RepID=UPI003078BC85